jgi:hypothetical protein
MIYMLSNILIWNWVIDGMKIVCTIYYILTIMNNGLRYLINEIYL